MSDTPPPPPAGWYPDPQDSSQSRYWDGANWTDLRDPKEGAGASAPAATPPAPAKGGIGCGGIGCLGIIAVVVIIFLVSMGSNSSERDAENQEGLAAIACQNVVRDNLRSPSTADFVGFPEVNGSIITGQVDAQNGFGATVRSSFQCTIVSPERVRLDFLE